MKFVKNIRILGNILFFNSHELSLPFWWFDFYRDILVRTITLMDSLHSLIEIKGILIL